MIYDLPQLLERERMLEIMQNEVYGFLPPPPEKLEFAVQENIMKNFCGGKAVLHKITATCHKGKESFFFPFMLALPTDAEAHPFFVHINFRDNVPDQYMPTEELIDNGFAVFSFCYKDVTDDNGDFTDGLAALFYPDGKRAENEAGKIALWAWAAQRVMDYAQTHSQGLDLTAGIVCGHSRLGKTALFAAATDERFAFAYSNDSGCSGAAITKGKGGEQIEDICRRFPFWFCENYQKYVNAELPFDQHFLVASIAPRKVLIGSASQDGWADPAAEQLCCFAAAKAFKNGFDCPGRKANVGEAFLNGDIGYHLRHGKHYFCRQDWHRLIEFVSLHKKNC